MRLLGKEPIVSVLKLRTRIVQLAIATVALAAMALGGSFTAHGGLVGGFGFDTATGFMTWDNGICTSDNPATVAVEPAMPAGNGAWGTVLYCMNGSLGSAILFPADGPANGVVAINGATAVVPVDAVP